MRDLRRYYTNFQDLDEALYTFIVEIRKESSEVSSAYALATKFSGLATSLCYTIHQDEDILKLCSKKRNLHRLYRTLHNLFKGLGVKEGKRW